MVLLRSADMTIGMLSPTRRVIPLIAQAGERWHTDVKLPDVVLSSNATKSMVFTGASLHAMVDGEIVASLFQGRESLKRILVEGNALLNKLVGRKAGLWRTYNLRIMFAAEPDRDVSFAEGECLQPSERACLRLDDLFACHVVHSAVIDEIRCCLTYCIGSEHTSAEFSIPLETYTCKGTYTFPIRGSLMIESTPWDRELGHRAANSQEFAFDVVDCRRLADGSLSLSSPIHSEHVSDYFVHDREVLAIGEGIVVSSGNEWPDAFAENPLAYSVDRVTAKTVELLDSGMEFAHAILGNYVILDHRNGEFSVYAHMREGSVSVKRGDQVKQGQPIGRVGNTSNSETPHLHFHLMDSPDFVTANGLPARFIDLPRTMASIDDYVEPNPLLYSSYIFSQTSQNGEERLRAQEDV